mgnify:CR=1 FL=1
MFNRKEQIKQLKTTSKFDIVVIGGGASGLGIAVDAASRGFKVALFEAHDFAKGTSSRSTKLVHGGVRYLAQGNIKLVIEALRERGLLEKNANHLFKRQTFLIPSYKWWFKYYYGFGLTIYDWLSARLSFGGSRIISAKKASQKIKNLIPKGLNGAVTYLDGQFDDARLALNLAQTAIEQGAVALNHFRVSDILKDHNNKVSGVTVLDTETDEELNIYADVVINATGVFANKILKLAGRKKKSLKIVPSQGIHLVLDRSFLEGETALMVPKTSDGRVLFAIPWHNKAVLGTTDTPIEKPSYEPKPLKEEIDFILETASQYFTKAPTRNDIKSVFAGLRPLVAPEGDKSNTKEISRGHKIIHSESGLITIVGGLSLSFFGRRILKLIDDLFKRIPFLRTVYSAIVQMTETFSKKDDDKKSVVLVEYPRKDVWAVGFATKENKGEMSDKTNKKLINVFVPTTPNPTSGFLLMIPKEELVYLDMTFEEASKFIVSAGTSNPKN